MSTSQIIAQIINGFGTTINMIGINLKDKKKVLIAFIVGNILVALAFGLLNAKSGMIIQTIFIIEMIINFFYEKYYSNKYPLWLILLYIVVPTIILILNYESPWDILQILAGIFFPLALVSKNFILRLLNLVSVVVNIPYCLKFGQYAGFIGCTIFTIANILAIIRLDIIKKELTK